MPAFQTRPRRLRSLDTRGARRRVSALTATSAAASPGAGAPVLEPRRLRSLDARLARRRGSAASAAAAAEAAAQFTENGGLPSSEPVVASPNDDDEFVDAPTGFLDVAPIEKSVDELPQREEEAAPAPDLPTDPPTDIPIDVPTDIVAELPTEPPTESPTEIPIDLPTEVHTEAPTDIPVDVPTEPPTEISIDVLTEVPTEVLTDIPIGVPIDVAAEPRTEVPIDLPTEVHTEAPTDIPVDVPTEPPTEISIDVLTEVPTEVLTDIPIDIPIDVPTDVAAKLPTEPSTEPRTEVPIDLPTEVHTEAPTDIPVDVSTETPTELELPSVSEPPLAPEPPLVAPPLPSFTSRDGILSDEDRTSSADVNCLAIDNDSSDDSSSEDNSEPHAGRLSTDRMNNSSDDEGPFEVDGDEQDGSEDEGPFEIEDVDAYTDTTSVDDPAERAWLIMQQESVHGEINLPDWDPRSVPASPSPKGDPASPGSNTPESPLSGTADPHRSNSQHSAVIPTTRRATPQRVVRRSPTPLPNSPSSSTTPTDASHAFHAALPFIAESHQPSTSRRSLFRVLSDRGHEPQRKIGRFRSRRREKSYNHRQRPDHEFSPDDLGTPSPSELLQRDVAAVSAALVDSFNSAEKAERVLMAVAKFAMSPDHPQIFDERRDALIVAGTMEAIVQLQLQHSESASVQSMANWAIANMCHEDPMMRCAFGRAGAVQAVVQGLEAHDGNTLVIEFALRALSALTWEPSNRATIGACGGLEIVISTMSRHMDMCSVQSDGATLLANSAYGNDDNKLHLAGNFGLDAIVTAMRGFRDDAAMQNQGCLALRNLTFGMPENKEIAGVKGSVNTVVTALGAHISRPEVVEQAATALFILVDSVRKNVDRLVKSLDWIKIILNSLTAYPEKESVQFNLLTVLAQAVVARPDKLAAIVEAGALEVAIGSMRLNVNRQTVLKAGARVARSLLMTGAPEAEAALRAAGGVGVLLELLNRCVSDVPRLEDMGVRGGHFARRRGLSATLHSIPSTGSPVSPDPEPSRRTRTKFEDRARHNSSSPLVRPL